MTPEETKGNRPNDMLEEIKVELNDITRSLPDSGEVTPNDVRVSYLLTEVNELSKRIKDAATCLANVTNGNPMKVAINTLSILRDNPLPFAEPDPSQEKSLASMQNQRDLLGNALCKVLIADGVVGKDAAPNGPELISIAEQYAEHRSTFKDRIVIQLNGGLVDSVITNTETQILKIEEPGDSDESELLEMYPDNPSPVYNDTMVYAGLFDATHDPEELNDLFNRYETAVQKEGQEEQVLTDLRP